MASIRAMPPDRGKTAWDALLPPRAAYSELVDAQQADYLVIGAGFAGLSAARRLQQLQPNARIVVLEGRKLAQGPAGRNSGFMIDLPHELTSDDYAGESADNDRRQTSLHRAAIRFAQDAAREYQMPAETLVLSGKTNAAATAKGMQHNAHYARHLDSLGETYRLLNADEMHALTGTRYYQGGLWTPGTAMLQPALYIRSLAQGLQQQDLPIFEQSPVIALNRAAGGWLATTPKGSVQAHKVILAVNGLVEHFGYYTQRLMHVMLYASITRALTPEECQRLGGKSTWGLTPADPLGTTVRRISGASGDRIIIRNCAYYDPEMNSPKHRMELVARKHQTTFKARFPMLAEVGMEYSWDGRLCLSRNSVFALGEVDDGVYSACCQNGLGTVKGTVSGIIAAEQAAGANETLLPDYRPESPPSKLMPEPLMSIGANAYLRWKEFRAGADF
ncbi:MAG: FAD-binding oxidoreductase [Thiolinea sp.]